MSNQQISELTNKISWVDKTIGEEGFKIDRKFGDGVWENEFAVLPANTLEFTDQISVKSTNIEYKIYAYYKNAISAKVRSSSSVSLGAPTHASIQYNSIH